MVSRVAMQLEAQALEDKPKERDCTFFMQQFGWPAL